MIHAAQIRAARALLGWRQEDLAKAAKSGLATVARIEQRDGPAQGHTSTVMRIEAALTRAGVRFFEDEDGSFGVRLIKRARKA
jgi:transcriptional regulator with XRE-family HTH domain